ncbi:MAG: hypothetical protein EHM70_07120 [Chloroflexota bacterium]|nr:MAG: hypothetical protein EHM70_07120 [Chloroflexota bacterium]
MEEIEKLEKAIAALEAQRSIIGEESAEMALAPLREKLAALRSMVHGEQRRQVTVLFADLAGFTALSETTDPEDVREILKEYFARWAEAIEEYHGVVEKYIGDAVMAVFGLAAGREQDPENAIRSALTMRESLVGLNLELKKRYPVQLRMRVGIHTGPVVASTLEDRKGQSFVAVGDTVNLASRLQSSAPVDGILISQDTYRLVRGMFDVQALEPLKVKGKTGKIQAFLVSAEKPKAFRMITRGVEGVETRMIGRETEFQRLKETFAEVLEDKEWRVVALLGEAGIGKSRLLYEFDKWLEAQPDQLAFFKGRAYPVNQEAPYALFRSLFAFRFQIQDSDPPRSVRDKIEAGIHADLPDDETAQMKAHFTGRLLGFELGESPYLRERGGDARQFQEQALHFLGSYFQGLAQQQPVVVLLEDIHWADNSSLELIDRLESYVADRSLLLICTARPALMERRPDWGEGLSYHTRVEVQPLSRLKTLHLLNEILQKVEKVPADLSELVVENAAGNPFYVEELVKMLIEDGAIVMGEEHWRVEKDRWNLGRVPPTLVGVLQTRFDSLHHRERDVLQRGAVIGRVFWDQAIAFMEKPEQEKIAEDDGTVPDLLENLRNREMIFQREKSTFDNSHEYMFKHALLRDVTYDSLLKRRRQRYHGHAARWLVQETDRIQRSEEYAASIAEHYAKAGEDEQAAAWYERSGKQAAARFANREAVWAYSQALELAPGAERRTRYGYLLARQKVYDLLGDREAQSRDLATLIELVEELQDVALEAEVTLEQARYDYLTSDYPAAIAGAEKAIRLAQISGDVEKEVAGYLLSSSILMRQGELVVSRENAETALVIARQNELHTIEAETLRHLGLVAYYTGNPKEALHFFEQALEGYTKTGDRKGQCMALNNLGGATFDLGDYTGAETYYMHSSLLSREIGDRVGECRASNNLGIINVVQGNYTQAEKHYRQALKISRELGHRSFEVSALDNLGNLEQYRYNYEISIRYHEESLRAARQIDDRITESITLTNLGRGFLCLGMFAKAHQYMTGALELYRQHNDRQGICHVLTNLVKYDLEKGDLEAALEHSRECLALAGETGARSDLAEAYYCIGRSLAAYRRFQEAIDAYRQSLEIRRELEESQEAVASLAGLAEAYTETGDLEQAQVSAGEILEQIEMHGSQGFDAPAYIFLACYRALQASNDLRAEKTIEAGYRLLEESAAKIEAEEVRQSFLENVPANRELRRVKRGDSGM